MKLGLENIRTLLTALGDPQLKFLKVQVAGTNGKGSVCAFLGAICRVAGVRDGVFTSPHLISVTERIQINGTDISEPDFAKHASTVRETAENLLDAGKLEYLPTFFEQISAIALVAFSEVGVELAILETGLGGRLDATTAANAEIAVITRIDYDHQEYLGETLVEIAGEKAAIIRSGSNVVIAEQDSDAMNVFVDRCNSFDLAPRMARDVEVKRLSAAGATLTFATEKGTYEHVTLGLAGKHQIENAKAAILAAEILQEHFAITAEAIVDGLKCARHPGRLESDGKFLFDGAHNPAGARALRAFLDEVISDPVTLIFGAMKEKDIVAIARELFPAADKLILTQPANSRALTARQLAAFVADGRNDGHLFLTSSVAEAIRTAEAITTEPGIILVTGSLYLVGEAKKEIADANLRIERSDLR
ncbi:MAG: folylpolyglutamate synthase/dihydrofolate synthase family protein [Acidobacteriota bacterium]